MARKIIYSNRVSFRGPYEVVVTLDEIEEVDGLTEFVHAAGFEEIQPLSTAIVVGATDTAKVFFSDSEENWNPTNE